MKRLLLLLTICTVACSAQSDPYPAYLAQLSVELNTASHGTQNWSYGGTQPNGTWVDYYIVEPGVAQKVIVHVPALGAQVSAAFVGDSLLSTIDFTTLMPDLATLNAGVGGEECKGTETRIAEMAALNPAVLVVACGNGDMYSTQGIAQGQTAVLIIIADAKSYGTPLLLAELTPLLSVLPTLPGVNPGTVGQNIRSFNSWLLHQAAASGVLVWPRWANISDGIGNYGIPGCYGSDGAHPINCAQMEVAQLRYYLQATAARAGN